MNKKKLISFMLVGALILSVIPGLGSTPIKVQANSSIAGPQNGLIAYWTFDDTYEESVGGLTTNLGAKKITYTEGIYGKAAVFNGKDNYLVVDADPILNLGNSIDENNDNFTISAWVNLGDATETDKVLIDKGDDAGWEKNDDYYWSNPYRLSLYVCEPIVELSNHFANYNVEPAVITEGDSRTNGKHVEGEEWFLLTVTYDGKRVKVYRDNELLSQNNYTDGITFNNDALYIGVDHKLSDYFKGKVDDLRIYTNALSYDEVDELYLSGLKSNKELVEPTKQLVAYYPFDDNLDDKSSFENNAEKVAIGGTTKYIVGKNGKAITMSKGNYINVPAANQLNFDSEFTVSFWIKLNEKIEEKSYPVLYRQNPSNVDNNDNDWIYACYIYSWAGMDFTDITINCTLYNPDSWVPDYGVDANTRINYDEKKIKGYHWIHYTATYLDGQLKTYINGKLELKSDKSDLVNISNASGDLLIGYDGSTFINGAIDELKIYNKCLTATDVEKECKRVDSISLSKANVEKLTNIEKGKSITLNEIILKDVDTGDTIEIKLSNKNFTFKTSNKKIFTVTSDGTLKGVAAGSAKLIITYGGHAVSYNVKVN